MALAGNLPPARAGLCCIRVRRARRFLLVTIGLCDCFPWSHVPECVTGCLLCLVFSSPHDRGRGRTAELTLEWTSCLGAPFVLNQNGSGRELGVALVPSAHRGYIRTRPGHGAVVTWTVFPRSSRRPSAPFMMLCASSGTSSGIIVSCMAAALLKSPVLWRSARRRTRSVPHGASQTMRRAVGLWANWGTCTPGNKVSPRWVTSVWSADHRPHVEAQAAKNWRWSAFFNLSSLEITLVFSVLV